jgi:hypothetical protein
MALKVQDSQFSNNGGGGSTFYMGRGQGDSQGDGQRKRRHDDKADDQGDPPELVADAFAATELAGALLNAGQPSRLSIWAQRPVAPVIVDEAALMAELKRAVHGKLRVLEHAVGRLERDYARRLRAEIGDMRIDS